MEKLVPSKPEVSCLYVLSVQSRGQGSPLGVCGSHAPLHSSWVETLFRLASVKEFPLGQADSAVGRSQASPRPCAWQAECSLVLLVRAPRAFLVIMSAVSRLAMIGLDPSPQVLHKKFQLP